MTGCLVLVMALLVSVPVGAGSAYYGYHVFDTFIHGRGISGDLWPLLLCIGIGALTQAVVKWVGENA